MSFDLAKALEQAAYTFARQADIYRAAGPLDIAASDDGRAAGYAFRAAELRYAARGGMTAATERRRFEPGARWALDGVEYTVAWCDDDELWLRRPGLGHGRFELKATITADGLWRFLGLSGGYR